MIDRTRDVRHVDVTCSGGTATGRLCRRFQWFPVDRVPEAWHCHDHRPEATR